MSRHVPLLLLSGSLIAGCGTAPSGGGGGAAPPPGTAQAVTVTVRDFEFSPASVTIPRGSTVVWRFVGPTAHSSTSDPGSPEAWDSGTLGPGNTYSRPFNSPGSFSYHCTPHPFMHGTVVVQ
jgi:plastocyanin